MNQVVIIGRLTKNPETRVTSGAKPMTVTSFTVAVDREKKTQGGATADFVPCKAFNKTAENIEKYLKKGSQVGVQGRIQTGVYEKDGKKVYTTEVIADRVEFLGSKNGNNSADDVQSETPEGFERITDEMIPF